MQLSIFILWHLLQLSGVVINSMRFGTRQTGSGFELQFCYLGEVTSYEFQIPQGNREIGIGIGTC